MKMNQTNQAESDETTQENEKTYNDIVTKVKATYKARLKPMSKSKLIDIISEISTQNAILRERIKELSK